MNWESKLWYNLVCNSLTTAELDVLLCCISTWLCFLWTFTKLTVAFIWFWSITLKVNTVYFALLFSAPFLIVMKTLPTDSTCNSSLPYKVCILESLMHLPFAFGEPVAKLNSHQTVRTNGCNKFFVQSCFLGFMKLLDSPVCMSLYLSVCPSMVEMVLVNLWFSLLK